MYLKNFFKARISAYFFVLIAAAASLPAISNEAAAKDEKTIALYCSQAKDSKPLADLLAQDGTDVKILEPAELEEIDKIDASLLVIGPETVFPPQARIALDKYLSGPNSLVLLSPGAFDYSRKSVQPVQIADFAKKTWSLIKPDDSELKDIDKIQQLNIKTCGNEDAVWLITPDLAMGDIFVDIPLSRYHNRHRTVLNFQARGDYEVDILTLKIIDNNGDEWYRFVELGRDWRDYTVSVFDFMPQKSRKAAAPLDPSNLKSLQIGLDVSNLWRDKPGSFALGPVYLGRASRFENVASSDLRKWKIPLEQASAQYPQWVVSPFLDAVKFDDAARVEPALGQNIYNGQCDFSYTGLHEIPPYLRNDKSTTSLGTDKGLYETLHNSNIRRIPILNAVDNNGRIMGPAAEIRVHIEGPRKRAGFGLFGIEGADYSADSVMGKILKQTCDFLLYKPKIRKITLFTSEFDQDPENLLCQVSLDNPLNSQVKGSLSLIAGGNQINVSREIEIGPDQTQECVLELGEIGRDFPLLDFDWKVTVKTDRGVDILEDRVSIEKSLIKVGKNMLDLRTTHRDKRISNHFFIDLYGARAMLQLGKYLQQNKDALQRNQDVLGDTRPQDFIRAAEELSDMICSVQDPDGSIPLGYSEMRKIRWVADNGSVALGLAQMALEFEPELAERCMRAAKNYVDWRHTFYISPEKSKMLQEKFGKDKWTRPGNYGFGYMTSNWDTKEQWHERKREERGPDYVLGICIGVMGALDVLEDCPYYHDIAVRDTKHFIDGDYSTASYFQAEGIFWMYYTLKDQGLKDAIKERLETSFLPSVINGKKYQWFSHGSRGSLLWLTLAYYYNFMDDTPAVRASLLKAIWEHCSDSLGMSMDSVAQRFSHSSHGNSVSASKYAGSCSSIWLMEMLEPGSTLLEGFPVE
ncbi:hypothetical protein SMSP2_00233 [Limihaloglobus sulfuriphilus]|uniref:Uncharacterized protein n=1 Tax=Limihaloglobus sulfuriphilus TaxID=1851148 RepID=A0A1Q2MB58_9BACT|nr:DUF4350 domain-containing protein [Limihaloglobus sulfuriphilus]AQQ69899.1 hypothetical protein SMSP2_00233 [Limihaloglobus sulfuriphilus]